MERALAALWRRTRKTDREALEAAKSAKWKNTYSTGTTIYLNGDQRMDR